VQHAHTEKAVSHCSPKLLSSGIFIIYNHVCYLLCGMADNVWYGVSVPAPLRRHGRIRHGCVKRCVSLRFFETHGLFGGRAMDLLNELADIVAKLGMLD
jgi:hypothetical protein